MLPNHVWFMVQMRSLCSFVALSSLAVLGNAFPLAGSSDFHLQTVLFARFLLKLEISTQKTGSNQIVLLYSQQNMETLHRSAESLLRSDQWALYILGHSRIYQ